MAVILRALALLSVSGASFALFVQELQDSWLTPFITANTLTLPNRQRLIIGMADRRRGRRRRRPARPVEQRPPAEPHRAPACARSSCSASFPRCATPAAWPNALNLVRRHRRLPAAGRAAVPHGPRRRGGTPRSRVRDVRDGSRDRWAVLVPERVRRWLPPLIVLAAVIGYAVYMSVFTLRMHGRFQTYNFDLGQYDNIFWSTAARLPAARFPAGADQELARAAQPRVAVGVLPAAVLRASSRAPRPCSSFSRASWASARSLFIASPRGGCRGRTRRSSRSSTCCYPPMHGMQFYDFHMQPIGLDLRAVRHRLRRRPALLAVRARLRRSPSPVARTSPSGWRSWARSWCCPAIA